MSFPLYIRSASAFAPASPAEADALMEAHRDTLPRAVGRRMSALGLAVNLVLSGETLEEDELLVFASEYGMTRSLEDYLASFPTPSPLAFQNSIHPAGVEQVLVPAKRSVAEFLPLAGDPALLLPAALRAIRFASAGVARLVVAEERGTSMSEAGCGSQDTYAAMLALTREPAGAVGRLDACGTALDPISPRDFVRAVATRRPVRFGHVDIGGVALDWL